jgi:NDP-sugar pyrophosphorylase family protein
MRVIAPKLPKSLIPIRNRPFLHYQLSLLAKQKIQNVILCVAYGGDQIERYVEDGRAWGLTIQYVNEGADLRGTGGALRLAYEQDKLEANFFVLSGDVFLPDSFLPTWAFFGTRTEPALMVVSKNRDATGQSHVLFDAPKITRYDKTHPIHEMTFVDSGLSLLRRDVIAEGIPPKSVYALEDLFQKLSARGNLVGFEIRTRFFSIGSPNGLQDFIAYVSASPARFD